MTPAKFAVPPSWTEAELESDRQKAVAHFRAQRFDEPRDYYARAFQDKLAAFEDLLEQTEDLKQLSDQAIQILCDERLQEALRYLAGPPISLDDLKVLAEVESLAPKRLQADPAAAKRLVDIVLEGLDGFRFPWHREARDPSEAERHEAILASAALVAAQRTLTDRRTKEKNEQEERVRLALVGRQFTYIKLKSIRFLKDAPQPGHFSKETRLGTRKADLLIGLWDGRCMPVECKVSNSSTNSVKRLNNDAAVKAQSWRKDFGDQQVVPTAVLSGVYKLHNLRDAQERGLTLIWAHDLEKLLAFVDATKTG